MIESQFTSIEQSILAITFIVTLVSFLYEVWRRLRIVFKGRDSLPFDRFGARAWRVF